ncbi:MAG: ribonuclease Z [Chitinophagaceae bacterium]|jgi:ribonuclease Z
MKLTILGNNSALPAYGRHPTAQLLEVNQQFHLIDCGEGTQMQLQIFGFSPFKIRCIYISHLHGDHYFGLVGLLSSLSLLGRTQELDLFGPPELKQILDIQLVWELGYPLNFHSLNFQESITIVDHKAVEVISFPVKHSVPTCGFQFIERKRKRILLPEKARELEVPKYFYTKLTEGTDYIKADGTVVSNEHLTLPGSVPKKYVYAADTQFLPELKQYFADADVLYHETTYLQADTSKAHLRMHATTVEAAEMALNSGVRKLLIGHFSSKYKDLSPFLEEAQSIFANTELALEGTTFDI